MSQIPRRSFTRLALAILVPLTIIVIAWQYRDQLDFGGDPVRLSASVPGNVVLGTDGTTQMSLKLALLNRTGEPMTLSVDDPCKVLRWLIQAPGEATIQSKGDKCLSGDAKVSLASGDALLRTETLELDSGRYTPGETYTVYVDFYGYVAKAQFRAVKASD